MAGKRTRESLAAEAELRRAAAVIRAGTRSREVDLRAAWEVFTPIEKTLPRKALLVVMARHAMTWRRREPMSWPLLAIALGIGEPYARALYARALRAVAASMGKRTAGP
jgi:hypothetical protein